MLYDCKRISYWIDRRLTGLAVPDYDAAISFGLPFESEDCQYGEYRVNRVAGNYTYLLASIATLILKSHWTARGFDYG